MSPPDEHGYCSLGTSVDCVRAAMIKSKYIIGKMTKISYVYELMRLISLNLPLIFYSSGKQTDA